jgi:hypothetical protein
MPKFKVRRRVDAFVDYVAVVEAEDPKEAAEVARADEGRYRWKEEGTCQFDARMFVTLDLRGYEIDGTDTGDF